MANGDSLDKKIQRLVDAAFKRELKNYAIDKSSASQCGNNWLGHIYRIKVEGRTEDDENIEFNLIAKIAPHQPTFRELFAIREDYEREIYTYNKIIPEFIQIQSDKRLENIFNPFTKCYVSTLKSLEEGLLMDDMKLKKFQPLDYQQSIDYHHASLIMRYLGKFHALSFAIHDQKREIFTDWQNACTESFFNSHLYEHICKIVTNLAEGVLNTPNGIENENVRSIFKRSIKNVPEIIKGVKDVHKFGKYSVISYGDYQVRNFLFKYENSQEPKVPTHMCMLDFQCLYVSTPAADISYFVGNCTDKQFRDRYYNVLIQEYYQSLSSFLLKLGSDPKIVFPYEVFLDHLKRFSVFGMYVGIWLIALDQKPKDNLPDLHNVIDKNMITEHLSVIPNDVYVERVRDLVSDYIKYGYDL